jgi:hypothetical protein
MEAFDVSSQLVYVCPVEIDRPQCFDGTGEPCKRRISNVSSELDDLPGTDQIPERQKPSDVALELIGSDGFSFCNTIE